MKKPTRVTIPIINVPVVWIVDCTKEEAAIAFYNYKNERSVFEPSRFCDGGVQQINGYIFLWVEKTEGNSSVVVHELVHVACAATRLCGIEPDEELTAYLMEWLKKKVMDKIYFGKEST